LLVADLDAEEAFTCDGFDAPANDGNVSAPQISALITSNGTLTACRRSPPNILDILVVVSEFAAAWLQENFPNSLSGDLPQAEAHTISIGHIGLNC
jgi:hypothetical protein